MDTYRPRTHFMVPGTPPRHFRPRDVIDADDNVVQALPHLFERVDNDKNPTRRVPTVEQATRAPGEARRDVTRAEDVHHVCDECGFEAKTAGGLGAHQRTHD